MLLYEQREVNGLSIGTRIRIVRKHYELNQTEFGKRIGLKQTAIGQYENGQHRVADRTILLICEKYSVNEKWLRTGEGDMLVESDSTIISQLADEYNLDVYEKAMISSFLKLKPEQRQFVRNWIKNAMDEISTSKSVSNKKDIDAEITAETTPDLAAMRVVNRDEEEEKLIARGVELMREQFELEKKQEA